MSLAPDTEAFAESIAERAARNLLELVQNATIVLPEFLTTAQAAAFCGFTAKAFEHHRKHGIGPRYARIGTKCRYRVQDLRAWMESNTVEPKAVKP